MTNNKNQLANLNKIIRKALIDLFIMKVNETVVSTLNFIEMFEILMAAT